MPKRLYTSPGSCVNMYTEACLTHTRNSYVDQHSVDSGTFHDEQPMLRLMPQCSSEHYSITIYLDSMA